MDSYIGHKCFSYYDKMFECNSSQSSSESSINARFLLREGQVVGCMMSIDVYSATTEHKRAWINTLVNGLQWLMSI